ncbi:hypothetical protein KC842_01225 [Candidatus Nomurabacteria bacterium]|nr:hypothetical protein [Candidatus Nomurabacteria bacterium]
MKKFLSEYPHIKLLSYPHDLFNFLFKKNIVITPPTFTRLPWHQKFSSWIISRNFQSKLFGFDDSSKINSFIYNKVVSFRTDILYIESLFYLAEKTGISFSRNNMFLKTKNISYFEKKPYIVFHPFGASAGRSLIDEKLKSVFFFIKNNFPNYDIYITGSSEDTKKLEVIEGCDFFDFTGKDIDAVTQLIKESNFFIGVDTGITHLANILDKRTLVLAENGTPHWLPFYNKKATILYKIKDDIVGTSREVLEEKRNGRIRFLEKIPLNDIEEQIKELSKSINNYE